MKTKIYLSEISMTLIRTTRIPMLVMLLISFFLILQSCQEEEEVVPITEEVLFDQEPDPRISKKDIERLNELIAEGKFDEELEASKNNISKDVGDGKSGGYFEFDFTNRKLILKDVKLGELCPDEHVGGDREFGGGPLITIDVGFIYSPVTKGLYAIVNFIARETRNDRSTVRLAYDQRFVFIRYIYGITSFDSEQYTVLTYRARSAGYGGIFGGCKDGAIEDIEIYPSMVKRFRIIGDTSGNDISTDDNCRCDTKIHNIELADIVMSF